MGSEYKQLESVEGHRETGDGQFADDLADALDLQYERAGYGGSDERMIELLDRIYRNNMRYSLCVPDRCINASGANDFRMQTAPTHRKFTLTGKP